MSAHQREVAKWLMDNGGMRSKQQIYGVKKGCEGVCDGVTDCAWCFANGGRDNRAQVDKRPKGHCPICWRVGRVCKRAWFSDWRDDPEPAASAARVSFMAREQLIEVICYRHALKAGHAADKEMRRLILQAILANVLCGKCQGVESAGDALALIGAIVSEPPSRAAEPRRRAKPSRAPPRRHQRARRGAPPTSKNAPALRIVSRRGVLIERRFYD